MYHQKKNVFNFLYEVLLIFMVLFLLSAKYDELLNNAKESYDICCFIAVLNEMQNDLMNEFICTKIFFPY